MIKPVQSFMNKLLIAAILCLTIANVFLLRAARPLYHVVERYTGEVHKSFYNRRLAYEYIYLYKDHHAYMLMEGDASYLE